MAFEIPKGTIDYEPKLQIQINFIIDTLRLSFEQYGFRPFDTPMFEFLETLTFKYEDDAEIVQEIYQLSDRGERALGLRYDLTTPLCRYVASHPHLKKPFRRYHIGKVFRDGPLKKGRMREFYQCDCDIVGEAGIEVEAELLSLFYVTYQKLGIDAIIELNNNKILRGALLQSGAQEKDLSSYILSIDKLKKINKEGVLKEIEDKGLEISIGEKALELLSCSSIKQIKENATNDLLVQGIEELEVLTSYLTSLKVQFRINFSMSRGLDIYTGNIWEAYDRKEKIFSSLGAGGRYDQVIGEYVNGDNASVEKKTEEIPAVGISFGLVPILEVLDYQETREGVTEILIVPLEKEFVLQSLQLANSLREQNQNVEIFYGYSMKKAFKYCDYLDVQKVIFLGKKDIENNTYTIKDLKNKTTEVFSL
jgi:histidyl-tRNA synthetase